MKTSTDTKILLAFGLRLVAVVVLLIGFYFSYKLKIVSINESKPEVKSTFHEIAQPIYGKPVSIEIYKANSLNNTYLIKALIIDVGEDSEGNMEAPVDTKQAGYWVESNKVGEVGNVVINGHLDDKYARPAAFFRLKNVDIDDKLLVVDEFGRQFSYKVYKVFYVDLNSPDKAEVFKYYKDQSTMTLITCGGVWLPQEGTYNKRLIVKAGLITK